MVQLEDYTITCPFCKQQHDRDINIDDDRLPDTEPDFLCKHPTANGDMCQRGVDEPDDWCWSHSDDAE